MAPNRVAGDRRETATETTPAEACLQASFRIEPHPAANCAVIGTGASGDAVTKSLGNPDESCDDYDCRSTVTVPGDEQRYLSKSVEDRCICPVFVGHDCVASIEAFEGDELLVTVTAPDRDVLSALVHALRDVGAVVRLDRICSVGEERPGRVLELPVNGVTEKQREAVRVAVESGYYDTPRTADLGDLAEGLGITKSAVSQRLSSVESKLVAEFYALE